MILILMLILIMVIVITVIIVKMVIIIKFILQRGAVEFSTSYHKQLPILTIATTNPNDS